jgi:NAD(P)-dependent dehydrogenase (short-subunit alcohol dehydrogenase family)
MARVFITGSSDGLGLLAGQQLARAGHEVVLPARNDRRAADTWAALPKAAAVVAGDLASRSSSAPPPSASSAPRPLDLPGAGDRDGRSPRGDEHAGRRRDVHREPAARGSQICAG